MVNSKVRDLSPLAALKQLNSLSINTYHIKDLDPIKDLKQLESLSLYNLDSNKSMDFLKHMPNITHIAISRSDIEDYSFLYSLPKLNSLYISNGIKDLSFLGDLTNLEYLNLPLNSIEDLTPISGLTNLKELDVGYNMIKDLGPLKELRQLTKLEANYNFIESLKGLENCKSLRTIYLDQNNIEDISPLLGLDKLHTLLISNNVISDISIIKDIKSLNLIDIYGNPVIDVGPIIDAGISSFREFPLNKIEEAGLKAHKIVKDIIDENMTDLDKEKVIYGYLIDNIEYDHQYYNYKIPTKEDPGGIYGALIHGWAVCDGYAHAMKVLGRLAGSLYEPYSNDYTVNYLKDGTWDDSTPYSITNVNELTLPPYSAVLYDIDYYNYDYIDHNTYRQGYLLSSNNTNEDKTFKANEIFWPLHETINAGMSIYYSIIIFDDYFDEVKLMQGRGFEVDNAVYQGRWVYDGLVPDKPKKDNTVPDDPITDIENNTIHNGNQMNNGMVIEKDGYYYYSKADENFKVGLVKVSIDTGEEVTIYDGTAYGLQIIKDHLYFYNDIYGLMRINLSTNALETVVDISRFQDGCTGWYYIYQGEVYYQSRVNYNLYKINLDSLTTSLVSENSFHYLNVVGDDIYYRNEVKNGNSNISKYNLLTGENTVILKVKASNVIGDGKYLYYSVYGQSQKTGRDSYSIYRANMDGSNVVNLYETESRITLRNIDNYGNIYILFNDEGIYKMSIVGFPEVKLEKISSDLNITTVIIGERQIYLFRGYYDPLEIINQKN